MLRVVVGEDANLLQGTAHDWPHALCYSVFICSDIVKNHWRDVRRITTAPVWSLE
jgi:hypothetical protein